MFPRVRRIATIFPVIFAVLMLAFLLSGCGDDHDDGGDTPSESTGTKWIRERRRLIGQEIKENEKNAKKSDESGKVALMEDQDEAPKGKQVEIFSVGSDLAVQNGGTPPSFTMNKDHWITELWTYHWNSGKGTPPGTIALKSAEGKTYGPWKTTLYNKVYWVAKPKMNLPAGKYTVIDSDPPTFAQNSETGGRGMAWMHGIPSK